MIYTQSRKRTSILMQQGGGTPAQDFNWLVKYQPLKIEAHNAEQIDAAKNRAPYFIAGTLTPDAETGKLKRNDGALVARSILVLDFDHCDAKKLLTALNSKLAGIEWLAYPTISNGYKEVAQGDRYRVAVKLDRPYKQPEHAGLLDRVSALLGFEMDKDARQWSQVMGLPVITPKNPDTAIVHNAGKALAVDQYTVASRDAIAKGVHKTDTPSPHHTVTIPDKEARTILTDWAERHKDELEGDDAEAFSASVIMFLACSERAGEISADFLTEAMDTIALGSNDWAQGNAVKLADQQKRNLTPNELSFRERFTGIPDAADDFDDWKTDEEGIPFPTTADLRVKLRADHAAALKRTNDGLAAAGSKKVVVSLPPSKVARILRKLLPMHRTSDDDGAIIYVYDPDTGIYSGNPVYLQRWVQLIEPNYDRGKVEQLRFFLQGLVKAEELEESPNLVPVGNGIFNYGTGTLLPFHPSHFFISKTATNYVPNAPEPQIKTKTGDTWTPGALIKSLACNDPEIEHLLFQVIADAANGNYSRGQAIFLLGSRLSADANGSNGKGTYQELIEAVVGSENTAHLTVKQLEKDFAALGLLGKSVDIGDDLQAGSFIDDSSTFNSAVTGDVIWTDVKKKAGVSFRFKGAVIQSTNEMPRFKNRTGGTYRRMVIVPFNAHFVGDGDNRAIKNDYIRRREVREWYLSQALALPFFERFDTPKAASDLLDDYKLENDPVRQFIEEIMTDATPARIASTFLYQVYQEWSTDNGFRQPLSRTAFTRRVNAHLAGIQPKRARLTGEEIATIKADPQKMASILPFTRTPYEYKKLRYKTKYNAGFTTPYHLDSSDPVRIPDPDWGWVFPFREAMVDILTREDGDKGSG